MLLSEGIRVLWFDLRGLLVVAGFLLLNTCAGLLHEELWSHPKVPPLLWARPVENPTRHGIPKPAHERACVTQFKYPGVISFYQFTLAVLLTMIERSTPSQSPAVSQWSAAHMERPSSGLESELSSVVRAATYCT
jgi:hypothetical protein